MTNRPGIMGSITPRMGIFGGTFSPFTVAHRAIVKAFIGTYRLDELYIIPTIVNYHREGKNDLLLETDKVEIIERMLDTLSPFYQRRIFIDKSEFAYRDLCLGMSDEAWTTLVDGRRFIHTLLDFNVRHGIDKDVSRPYVCIGTDSFEHLDQWYMNTEIVKICNLVVVQGRNDVFVSRPKIPHTEFRIAYDYEKVSASKIRDKMRCRNWSHYIADVKRLDEGKTTLAELGWI
jgi:nicotinic acid mononucleotide adenylyltransferase